jgi:cytochrome P450
MEHFHRPPSPRAHWLLGSTLDFQQAPIDFCTKVARECGDVARFRVGYESWYLLTRPEHVYEVLVNKAALFNKPKLAKRLWKLFLGNGLLASDGDFWRRQHKLVLPGFHKQRIEAYSDVMVRYTEDMLAGYKDGERRDVCEDMTDLTLAIVAKTLFDADVTRSARKVGAAIKLLNEIMVDHVNNPIPVPKWWPSDRNRRKMSAIRDIETIVRDLIAERRQSKLDRGDLFSMLVNAEDEGGAKMSDEELRDEAMTLLFAGHETTANSLTWTFYELARNPEVEARLVDEVSSVLRGRSPTIEDLKQLPYLDMVVKESMRILPSVWAYMREPQEDVRLGEHVLPKGCIAFISPYVLHHDARYFPEPERFMPERFSRENEKAIPRGAYVPFAAGPRVCLGKSFAMMEARLVLATVIQRVRVELAPGQTVTLSPKISLRPADGLPATVRLRAPAPTTQHATA